MSIALKRRELIKSLGMGAGQGAEVTLQTTIANEVIPLIRQQCFMRQIAEDSRSLINMTKPKIRVPKLVKAQGAYSVKSGQPAPEFKARLEGVDLEPEKIMAWLPIDQEVFEDSTVKELEGILKAEMGRDFAQAEEAAFMLGDKEQDFGAGSVQNVFDGLFKQAAAPPLVYNSSLDTENNIVNNMIRAIRQLGIYGRNKRDVIILTSLAAEEALLRSKAFQTMSAYAFGGGAGIFTGELGRIGGATVITSSFLDPAPGETFGKCLVMAKDCFVIGDWANFTINVYNEILSQTDQVAIRARERIAFAVRYPEAICEITNFPGTSGFGN